MSEPFVFDTLPRIGSLCTGYGGLDIAVHNIWGGRIAPVFVEWLMGLPLGWVTNRPLARTRQISILGAGVVPQQAEYAIRAMTGLLDE